MPQSQFSRVVQFPQHGLLGLCKAGDGLVAVDPETTKFGKASWLFKFN